MLSNSFRTTTSNESTGYALVNHSEQAGLAPVLIYPGPVAWHPPTGLYRTATGRLVEETEFNPRPDPWLLRPIALPPAWYGALEPADLDDSGVWWGPMCPVLAPELQALAFRDDRGSASNAPPVSG